MSGQPKPPGDPAATVEVHCPKCGEGAKVPARALGKKAGCNRCGTVFVLGGEATSAAAPAHGVPHAEKHSRTASSHASPAPAAAAHAAPYAAPAHPSPARPAHAAPRVSAAPPQPVMMEAPPFASISESPTFDAPMEYSFAPPRSAGGNRTWLIVGGIAAALLIGGVFWWINRGDDSKSTASGPGSPAASTALLNFKVTGTDRDGPSVNFSFDTDPATKRVQTLYAVLGDNLKALDDMVDPDYSNEPKAMPSGPGSPVFCTVNKDGSRPNGWTGRATFYGSGQVRGATRVSFVYCNDAGMISQPLIVSVNFDSQASEIVPLPANAPQARMSKAAAQMARMGDREPGRSRDATASVHADDIESIDPIEFEGPGSRGVLAGDFSPSPTSIATSRGGGGGAASSGEFDGTWDLIEADGQQIERGMMSFTISGNLISSSGPRDKGGKPATLDIDRSQNPPLVRVLDERGQAKEPAIFELRGSKLVIRPVSGREKGSSLVFERR
jgi:hypothetical protein